ncbi:MAG: hypothetical protein GY811_13305 [Myxococcales bacterium]|nr:hypothetical protein [Myxococcales bacterium]
MNRTLLLVSVASLALLGCKKSEKKADDGLEPATISRPEAEAPAGHGGRPPTSAKPTAGKAAGAGSGTVAETMNAGGYTYVKFQGESGDVWAAAPETAIKVGDSVSYTGGTPMQEFRSNTLKRTFQLVYLVPGYTINGDLPKVPSAAGAKASAGASAAAIDLSGIAKAEGGKTVAEVYSGQAELGGKEVSLRGKVVKYNGGILGTNWIHLRDGSGVEGTNDLTITTSATTEVGATLLVKGKLTLNKDFGAGYKYAVIIEDATITPE